MRGIQERVEAFVVAAETQYNTVIEKLVDNNSEAQL